MYSPHPVPKDTTCVCPGPSEKVRQQGRSRGESSTTHPADMRSVRRSSCAVSLLYLTCPVWIKAESWRRRCSWLCSVCHRGKHFYPTIYVCSPLPNSELHFFTFGWCHTSCVSILHVRHCARISIIYLFGESSGVVWMHIATVSH